MAKKCCKVTYETVYSVASEDNNTAVVEVNVVPANETVKKLLNYPNYTNKGIAKVCPTDTVDPIVGQDLAAARAKRLSQIELRDDLDQLIKYLSNLLNLAATEQLKLRSEMAATKEVIDKLVNGTYKKN